MTEFHRERKYLENYPHAGTIAPPVQTIPRQFQEDCMDRRTFIKATGTAVVLAPVLIRETLAAREPSLVAVAEGTDYAATTRKAINGVGGMKRFVKAGDVVVVKPNMGWDRSSEFGANTHPQVVRAVVEECLAAGAKLA